MRVTLDDQPCSFNAANVEDALAQAAEMAQQRDRLIVEVIVDGESWNDRDLADPDVTSVPADDVRLVTACPRDLVSQTFEDAAATLDDIDGLHKRAAEQLQVDHRPAAMQSLADAIGMWQIVQEAVSKGAGAVGIDLADVHGPDCTALDAIGTLNEHLTGLRDALVNDDGVAIADTLLYELPEVVDQWRAVLDALQQVITNESSQHGARQQTGQN